ncbi:MAG: hypothetical protein HZA51_03690 [Planctomycetes bacterium]|nr:hypothetical protein [Planctomycetota bacterium]
MSTGKIIIAGIVGGIAMFLWGAISHMATPLGEAGFKSMPDAAEAILLPQMKVAITTPGMYFIPGMNDRSDAGMKTWEEKIKKGPHGILIFDPGPGSAMSPRQLITEWGSNTLASIILAVILARINGSRGKRMLLGAALGFFAWMSIDVSYWNWYEFPSSYAMAQMVDQTVGGLAAAAGIVLVLGKAPNVAKA